MKINIYLRKFKILFLVLGLASIFSSNKQTENINLSSLEIIDLPQIRENGKMIVVTDFNSINYFIYKGKPMGFQYELLQELADFLDLELEVKVNNDLQQNFESLIKGEVDLIASNLTITKERKNVVAFTEPHSQSVQVLVQRNSIVNSTEKNIIRNPMQLAGKTVHVMKNSSHSTRLLHLSEEIGENIDIKEVSIETEQLIRMVAKGEIDYTVADENIAIVNTLYYPEIDIKTALSIPQNQAWAIRKNATELKTEIDKWLGEFRKSHLYAVLFNKYFQSSYSATRVKSEYYYPTTGRISKYDDIFQVESSKIGWDWRLLASMVYQESRFNHEAESWAGAYGIMQLMPSTADRYGVSKESTPAENIRAGVKFIIWLDERFKNQVPDKNERIKFILASYNIGYGHIADAMRLAEKYEMDPGIWENNVRSYLLKKSEPEFYNDPVVKYGSRKGVQTCNYVDEVLYRYQHYLNLETLAAK